MKRIIILLTILSCSTPKELTKVKFSYTLSTVKEQKKKTCYLNVPKGYELSVYKAGGESGVSHVYKYSDSSFIYISDMVNNYNAVQILEGGFSSKKTQYQLEVDSLKKELNLFGKDKNGFYWRELCVGNLMIGYSKVTETKKTLYDKTIETYKCSN